MNTPQSQVILGRQVRAIAAQSAVLPESTGPAFIEIDADGHIRSLQALNEITDEHRERADLVVESGMTLMPGGVDTHVHLNEPGRTEWEGFATGTRAAAAGGITTVIDMPLNSIPPTVSVPALGIKSEAATGQLSVDTGFWGGAVPSALGQLEQLWDAGVAGFKCFTSDSGVQEFPPLAPEQLRQAMKEIAGFSGLLVVHAEAPEHLVGNAPASSKFVDFLLTRPEHAEVEAIRAVLNGVRETGCRTHILHLSAARALDLIAAAKEEGLPVTVETCPHYLSLSAENIPDASPQFKCCPPVRDTGNQNALWQALSEGLIDMVVSDHSPATAQEKFATGGDLMRAWGGISGLQVGMSVTTAEALARGFTLADVSRWTSANPAHLVGLTDRGRIAQGATADFAVWDSELTWQIQAQRLEHRNPITAYDGADLKGAPVVTLLRGQVIATRAPGSAPAQDPEVHLWGPSGQQLRMSH